MIIVITHFRVHSPWGGMSIKYSELAKKAPCKTERECVRVGVPVGFTARFSVSLHVYCGRLWSW